MDNTCSVTVDELLPVEIEIFRAIGKIKRQKQRASFDRIHNAFKLRKDDFPHLESNDGAERALQDAIKRGVLTTVTVNGELSYKELGPGIAIVAQIARRKNAASLAASYSLPPELEADLLASPTETPKPAAKSRANSLDSSSKSAKSKDKVAAGKTPKRRASEASPSGSSSAPSKKKPKKALATSPSSVDYHMETIDEVARVPRSPTPPLQASPRKTGICGICNGDSSKDGLISCSLCGLSGECNPITGPTDYLAHFVRKAEGERCSCCALTCFPMRGSSAQLITC